MFQHQSSAGKDRRTERSLQGPRQARLECSFSHLSVRWIHEDHIERSRTPRHRGERLLDARWKDLGPRADFEAREILAKGAQGRARVLHERRARSAARERLDAERAGSSVKIEHPRAFEVAEDRKERLAYTIGRGSRRRARRGDERATPEPPRDHAQHVALRTKGRSRGARPTARSKARPSPATSPQERRSFRAREGRCPRPPTPRRARRRR